jgi:hypothetical protein
MAGLERVSFWKLRDKGYKLVHVFACMMSINMTNNCYAPNISMTKLSLQNQEKTSKINNNLCC